jgi:NAD(P)-dependent dehydrogenase (short-subunit alcohol dehydrogenase family)
MEKQLMTGFAGLTVVVSGGSSGIGAAAADAFAARGANVAVLDLNLSERHWSRKCDIADDNQVRLAVAAAKEQFGGIDIVVNNAGIGAVGTVEENSDKQWFRVLDVNLLGMVRLSRACLPHLRESAAPAIVNTTSIAATTGLVKRALYSASKGAVHSLTLAMAADHVAEGIRVNCVSPGTADTPWVQRLLEQAEDPAAERARLEQRQPTGRLVTPEEVAAAIVYLADPANKSLTGTSLAVDGGVSGLRIVR